MTSSDPNEHPTVPVVVPRWEWRTFAPRGDLTEALALLPADTVQESDEVYVLSLEGDASVKLRAGVLDVKVEEHVDGDGLQQWRPVLKATFPLDGEAAAVAFGALGLPAPEARGEVTEEQWWQDLVGTRPELRAVPVHKRRRRGLLDGCMVEATEIEVDGVPALTVAVESPDQALVSATIARLGVEGRRNTCVARGLKSLLGWGPERVAVLDVGTNSVKLHVGERAAGSPPRPLVDRSTVTRLGEGLAEAGRLTVPSMDRTVEAIAELVAVAREGGPVDIVSVGTAGMRQAPNRGELVDAVFARTGVTVEVISGKEEARLAYLAAVSSLPRVDGPVLVFDSGGGSSQFTFGEGERLEEQFSLDIGAVRVTERYGLAGAVDRDTVDQVLAGVREELGRLEGRPRPDAVVAIGGTSTNLAAVRHALREYDADVVHGTVLTVAEVDRQIEAYRQRSADERREIVGLQPARAEVILAGACIVRTILAVTEQDSVTVSDRGLRHGVADERFGS
ncbi:MAG TPA: Ppx/GppA phosphatase family protein [Phycicoccus sp.]|nr:Ppx/GppA phosphatase family protein [Phycicoccus sp.]